MYFSGDGHNHWHVRDLERYVLESQNGATRLYGEKHGFCFWDNVRYAPSLLGYPLNAVYTGSNSCVTRADRTVLTGLSIGWGDRYPATITDPVLIHLSVADRAQSVPIEALNAPSRDSRALDARNDGDRRCRTSSRCSWGTNVADAARRGGSFGSAALGKAHRTH